MDAIGVATVLATSVVKFLFAGLVSYGFKYSFWQTVALTAIGASIGTVAFFKLGAGVLEWFRKRWLRRRSDRLARGLSPQRIFTRTNRFIIHLKHNYGLLGLAVMPPILSVPITSVLAAKYFRHDRRALPFLLAVVCAWSVLLSTAWAWFR